MAEHRSRRYHEIDKVQKYQSPHVQKQTDLFSVIYGFIASFAKKVAQMINGCSISYSRSFFSVCIIAFVSFQPDGLSVASVRPLGFLLTLWSTCVSSNGSSTAFALISVSGFRPSWTLPPRVCCSTAVVSHAGLALSASCTSYSCCSWRLRRWWRRWKWWRWCASPISHSNATLDVTYTVKIGFLQANFPNCSAQYHINKLFSPVYPWRVQKSQIVTNLSFFGSISVFFLFFYFSKAGRDLRALRAPPCLHQPPTDWQDTETVSVSILGKIERGCEH